MVASFFKINPRSIVPKGWGDYGVILQQGMTAHLPRVDGKLALERAGPHIPPITLPGLGDIVPTSEARRLLESSGLSGFSFRQVEKVLIVELHCELWNLDANEPAQYPESGEAEDYILDQPQSQTAANALGDL